MKKLGNYLGGINKKIFTLVELIIVITILAILSVSAFLVISQWIGKSRDSRRLSDLGTIQRALEVSLTENAKYPTPDTPVNITAGSVILGQQGKFGDSATAATDIKTTPKDPLDNVAYSYYVATGGESYQVMGFLENSSTVTFRGIEAQGPRSTVSDQENLQFSNSACTCNSNGTNSICSVASLAFCLNYAHASEVSAADYSVRIPTVKGETLGILILSGTNQPVEEIGSTVDLSTSTSSLIAVFSNTDKSSGTGGQIISPISIKNPTLLSQPSIVAVDNSLLGYWDMESVTATGALKDFSKNALHGTLNGGVKIGTVAGLHGQATSFDGVDDVISIATLNTAFTGNSATILIQLYSNKSPTTSYIPVGTAGNTNGGYLEIYPDNTCVGNIYFVYWTNVGTANASETRCYKNTKWTTVVGIYNNGIKLIYVDGVLKSTTNVGSQLTRTTDLFYIGGIIGRNFNGAIDEVRVYNRALTEAEIQALSR